MNYLFYAVPVMGLIGLIYTFIQNNLVAKQDAGDDKMQKISTYIAEGAMAFLQAEWKILGYFVGVVALLLGIVASANPVSYTHLDVYKRQILTNPLIWNNFRVQ